MGGASGKSEESSFLNASFIGCCQPEKEHKVIVNDFQQSGWSSEEQVHLINAVNVTSNSLCVEIPSYLTMCELRHHRKRGAPLNQKYNRSFWMRVAALVPNRTPEQCLERYTDICSMPPPESKVASRRFG
mmetsp:Transcript_53632/g.142187  ORF Transcript_53632/g.142187 Transcript_53632/m.142187 type:complete len:130 (+) Transcript_53632:20-409(+)